MNENAFFETFRKDGISGIQLLLAEGISINTATAMGRTLLHIAVAERQSEHIPELLALGADSNAQDVWGYTPLHEAAFWGDETAAEHLLAAGARPDMQVQRGLHEGAWAFHIAKRWKRSAVLARLEAQTPPDSMRLQGRRKISRAGFSVMLDLSVSKLPQQALQDFRTRYSEPLKHAAEWP